MTRTYGFVLIVCLSFCVIAAIGLSAMSRRQSSSTQSVVNDPELGTVMTDELLIFFSSTTTPEQAAETIAEVHGTVFQSTSQLRMWHIVVPPSATHTADNIKSAMRHLLRLSQVERVVPNQVSDSLEDTQNP